ncbi:hypothetical protein T440DRAFT_496931 [Plenodomus tracheiphilus IPT5]|uniref:Uncharacterized protein n=1 Tax=Plenodomus tracheiphilus IPT5 TaxID=1408161 RepID=A0A6A7BFM5_9PLEO|nr:hypothetical protein T440DRAFT_496931 [Plenodomus tracheiphilus IPT5]
MRFLLRDLVSRFTTRQIVGKRDYAHVHDIKFEWQRVLPGEREKGEQGTMSSGKNVFGQPLSLHSTKPLTGYTRTGYCEAPKSDAGNHSIAGILTNEFLDFSAARGNDLRQVGLTDGCKWCLCVSRWKEAFDARTGGDDKKVPKVVLKATNERALEKVGIDELKGFAVDRE